MIPARVVRVRVDQDAQAAVVEHQPGHQCGKQLRRKGHLVHGLIVGTDFDVMPSSQGDGKTLVHPSAQPLGLQTREHPVINKSDYNKGELNKSEPNKGDLTIRANLQ